jgi:putative molybdopterin biosynthesis protein
MVKTYQAHVSLEEAWEIMRIAFKEELFSQKNPAISQRSTDASGYFLAAPVMAKNNIPHYHASAVDGFAIRSVDSLGATPTKPKALPSSACTWVNTGSPVEKPFNTVIMVEDISYGEDGETILLHEPVHAWEHIRTVGEDTSRGNLLGRKYEKVTPEMASLFLAAGVASVEIFRPLQVTFIPTGEELLSPEESFSFPIPPGKVVDTNSLLVEKTLLSWGLSVHLIPPVKDNFQEIKDALTKSLETSDIILIGAGTAKGKRDHTLEILESRGNLLFQGVRTKPGRPAILGVVGNTPVLGLPGFPMSTLVTLWGILYPLIMLMSKGCFDSSTLFESLFPKGKREAVLLTPHTSSRGVLEWLRVRTVAIDETLYALPLRSGSSSLRSMAEAEGIAVLPEETYELQKNDPLTIWIKKDSPGRSRILYQGSNDPGIDLMQGFITSHGGELLLRSSGSLGGLAALTRKEAHLAATHLVDPDSGEYNNPFITQLGLKDMFRTILYWRSQGIIVSSGNPLNIDGIEDLFREEVSIVNRQIGTGTRSLLDMLLKKHGRASTEIRGYEHLCSGHTHGAAMVAEGEVQAMIGIKAAADLFSLDFIPLCEEPFEILIPQRYMSHPGIRAFLKTVEDPQWRNAVDQLGGYRWNN